MARHMHGGVWWRSLVTAFVLYALFQLLSHAYSTLSFVVATGNNTSDVPIVTLSLVLSEVANTLSKIVHNWPWMIFYTGVALVVYGVAGCLTTRQTGSVKAGIRAGVLAGLFYGLLISLDTVKLYLIYRPTLTGNISDPTMAQLIAYTYAQVLINIITSSLFSVLYYGLLAGLGGGLLGAYYASRFPVHSPKPALQSQKEQVEDEERE